VEGFGVKDFWLWRDAMEWDGGRKEGREDRKLDIVLGFGLPRFQCD